MSDEPSRNLFQQQEANRRRTTWLVIGFVLFFAWLGFGGDFIVAGFTSGAEPGAYRHAFPWIGVLLTGLGAGLASYARRDWRDTMLLTLPGVLGGGTMLALGHNLWPRFFLFCMGFALLIVVRGIMAIAEWIAPRLPAPRLQKLAVPLGVAVCLAGVVVSATTLPRSYRPKQDFSGARQYVESARQPGDDVVAVGLAGLAYRRYYAPEWPFVERRADLEMIQDRAHGVWLVYTLPVHLKAWVPEVWDVVQRDYEIVRVFPGTLGGGDVVVCRWRGRPRVSSGGAG